MGPKPTEKNLPDMSGNASHFSSKFQKLETKIIAIMLSIALRDFTLAIIAEIQK
jgi:hypothetical protein